MIRTATENDRKAVFDLYGRSMGLNFVNQEDYFAKKFAPDRVLVNEVNGHVAASLQVDTIPVMLNGRRLAASYIYGTFQDRNRGARWAATLMEEAVAQQCYRTLITIIPTEDPASLARYGFEEIYRKRCYTISQGDLDNQSYAGVGKNFEIDELMSLYNDFASHFDGYRIRDRQYWLDLIDLLQFKRYNLAVYHDDEGKPAGYMIYYIEASRIVVTEIVYRTGIALTRLLCYGLRLKNTIKVFTSASEDLSRAFERVRYVSLTRLVAKVNDLELFNRLYGSNVTTAAEAFALSGRGAFLSEESY